MHESRGNPLAIGLNGGYRLPRQPKSKAEAVETAKWLAANGYNFDAGLGQINIKNVGRLGMSVEDLFEPCANLRAVSTILTDCYGGASRVRAAGPGVLRAALSCYNTGDYARGERNGYVGKIAAQLGAPVVNVQLRSPEPLAAPSIVSAVTGSSPNDPVELAGTDAGPSDAFSASAAGDAFSRAKSATRPNIDGR
jgi:type IV secretion system protein VirB1